MGLTVTENSNTFRSGAKLMDHLASPLGMKVVTFTFDTLYPTGGEALTAATLGFSTVLAVIPCGTPIGYGLEYDHTNSKLLAYYSDDDDTADGPLIEVANGTDLSSLTGRLLVIGYV